MLLKIRLLKERAEDILTTSLSSSVNCLFFLICHQVLRRSGDEEKILVIARKRADHVCDASLIVVNIVLWEGISQERADFLYNHLSTVLPQHGVPTVRRCGINET